MASFGIVFPGQGSQQMNMLVDLYEANDVVRDTFLEASDALSFDLWSMISDGPESDLNKTFNTQPAILSASVALWRLWKQQGGVNPEIMAGHSLGEYSALTCAGAFHFSDAVKLVAARGKFMTEAVAEGEGAMAAVIGLEDAAIIDVCDTLIKEQSDLGVVSAVNFNSPGQVVIAGNKAAVGEAEKRLKDAGASKVLPLAVSAPSHCVLMKPAADQLSQLLQETSLNIPEIPVINNVDVAIESNVDAIREALIRQLYSPVRWTETVQMMANNYALSTLYEFGPKKALTGLTKRITKALPCKSVNTVSTFASALEAEQVS